MDFIPSSIKSGLIDGADSSTQEQETITIVLGILRSFAKEACVIAATYVHTQGRQNVRADDMCKALKFCARTFFQKEDSDLKQRLQTEIDEMKEESGEEESGEEESGEEEVYTGEPPTTQDIQLVSNIDLIESTWDKWSPTDPVHILLKRAIDNTTPK